MSAAHALPILEALQPLPLNLSSLGLRFDYGTIKLKHQLFLPLNDGRKTSYAPRGDVVKHPSKKTSPCYRREKSRKIHQRDKQRISKAGPAPNPPIGPGKYITTVVGSNHQ